jgi:hypothetical protein
MLMDLLSLLLGSVALYAAKEPGSFRLVLAAGIVLAALCWYVCTVYTRLWNRQFHITVLHHVVCGFASACTLLFVIVFASLSHTKEAALVSINLWQLQLKADQTWEKATFAKAYHNVQDLGTEDFSKAPPPESPGSFIPTNSDKARQTAASTYANEAAKHFDLHRPFLSKIAWSSPGVPSEIIFADVRAWHAHNPNYPPSRAIDIAAFQIKKGLEPQAPRVVALSRVSVAALFLLVQSIPFGLIGWAAYRDIKVGA